MKFYFGEKIMEIGLLVQKLWRFKVEVRVFSIARGFAYHEIADKHTLFWNQKSNIFKTEYNLSSQYKTANNSAA